MTDTALKTAIEQAWADRESLTPATKGSARDAVEAVLEGLDSGKLRVAEKGDGEWQAHQWLKRAVLVSL